jgi:hypothetical protein
MPDRKFNRRRSGNGHLGKVILQDREGNTNQVEEGVQWLTW